MLRPSKFEGHCPMIRHGCRMALQGNRMIISQIGNNIKTINLSML
ncbi:MAG: hypothetical protein BECKG1743D_GA0114223_107261 [Candidatus Kentron sp. G]|nr:MAG: hypothetical protein BECKG1743E_GA0114224_107121 [Candidatus Kentron sp. G]VFN05490.1 MAG: hypothetical protein BECKG1743D_GA0114223_107261 [Candidatus Kentron sp. G]